MSDPLAPFRDRPGLRDEPGSYAGEDSGEYEAFKAVDRRRIRLEIRPLGGACEWVTYSYLLHIAQDCEGTWIGLVFTFMTVVIKGRNLHEVSYAIAEQRCDFIQAYDGKMWSKPRDTSAAFIESIEVQAQDVFSEKAAISPG